ALGGDGLYRSDDQGTSWQPIGSGLPFDYVDALAVSPQGVLYAGDFGTSGIYQSADHGASWSPLAGAPDEKVIFLAWAEHCPASQPPHACSSAPRPGSGSGRRVVGGRTC